MGLHIRHRPMCVRPSYVQMAGRNLIDPHTHGLYNAPFTRPTCGGGVDAKATTKAKAKATAAVPGGGARPADSYVEVDLANNEFKPPQTR